MHKSFGLLTVLLVSTLTVSADSQWQKLGYSEGKGAVDHRSMSKPAKNTIYSCQFTALGGALNRPWIGEDGTVYFTKKPFVKGSKSWNSTIKFDVGNPNIAVTGNGLPNHTTGEFPINSGSTAYQYDRNPNSIKSQRLNYALPKDPKIASQPSCLPMGAIGIALSGGVFFNALWMPINAMPLLMKF